MLIRDAGLSDIAAITAIYNHAVLHTTAIWNDTTISVQNRIDWLQQRQAQGYPVLVAVNQANDVLGYASFGEWRPFDGYKQTVEHSVYVREGQQGAGIGTALMRSLMLRARQLDKHVMVAAVDADNIASIKLHLALGFQQVGLMPQVGRKFGRWLDLVWLQLVLSS
jgi:L-amino acid N-acyltransferase YncA